MGYEVLQTDGGEFSTLLVTSKENSNFTVIHSRLNQGASTTIHYHTRDYEAFYVQSGKVRFISGNESQYVLVGLPGTIVVCPPYCTRSYQAVTNSILIIINFPSGPGEEFIRDITSLQSSLKPKRVDEERFSTRYGIYINKAYQGQNIRPIVADLNTRMSNNNNNNNCPLVVNNLCFSHGIIDDDDDDGDCNSSSDTNNNSKKKKKNRRLWLFACSSSNKLPHSLPILGSSSSSSYKNNNNSIFGPDVFCVGRA